MRLCLIYSVCVVFRPNFRINTALPGTGECRKRSYFGPAPLSVRPVPRFATAPTPHINERFATACFSAL